MVTEKITIRLVLDTKGYKKGAQQASRATDKVTQTANKTNTSMGKLQGTLGKVGIAFGAAFVAKKLINGLSNAVARAEEMNSAYAITDKILEQTGHSANVTAEEMKNLARQQSLLTGIDKALVTESNNILLTFKAVRNEIGEGNDVFNQASGLILDMATVMGTDAKSGAIQLGKALNDPILGVSALNRVGIQFTETQKEQIKGFQESGDLMSAQKIILAELEGQLGGTAEAAADDSAKISRAWDEISESIGGKLLPVLAEAAKRLPVILRQVSFLDSVSLEFDIKPGNLELTQALVTQLRDDIEGGFLFSDFLGGPLGTASVDLMTEAIRELTSENEFSVTSLLQLEEILLRLGVTASGAAKAVREELIEKAFGAGREPLANFNAGLTDIEKAFGTTRKPIQNFNMGIKTAGTAAATADGKIKTKNIGQLAREYREAAAGVRDLKRAMLESTSPLFAAIGATDSLRTAEENLKDVRASTPDDLLAIALAEAEVAEATIRTEDALLALGDGNINRGIALIAEAMGKTIRQTEEWLVLLGVLDGTTFTVRGILEFETLDNLTPIERAAIEAAAAEAERRRRIVRDATRGGTGTPSSSDPFAFIEGGLAHGGRAHRGGRFLVGELGPEMFIPSQSGQIVPNNQLTTGAVNEGDQNITFVTSDDLLEDAQVVSLMLANRDLVRGGFRGGAR